MKRRLNLTFASLLPIFLFISASMAQTPAQRPLTLDDLAAFREVSDPQISPDGAWVVYTVSTVDMKEEKKNSDLWMTSWDGARTLQLTFSKESEHTPRWSPDGKALAFLSSRNVEEETDQVWRMNRDGGEAEKITDCEGGVTDYVWSPDGKRLALIVADPDSEAMAAKDKTEKKTPKPIVIDRYQFKKDEAGYLRHLRQHLYVFDLATRQATLLTPGDDDEYLPAWSPDNSSLVFVSKRGVDSDRDDNYDLYVIAAQAGAAKLVAPLDRNMYSPQWSADGAAIYFLVEEDRTTLLAKVLAAGGKVERLLNERCVINDFALAPNGNLVLLASRPQTPYAVFALENNSLRPLARKNEALLAKLQLGAVEEISFKSKDATTINGFVVKPPDYVAGKKYPALLRIHGGPVSQFGNEFMLDWQLFAAHGYVVVACNPRGSSGRGEKFSTAIYADWGNKDAQDVLAAVDHVVALGLADPQRLGVGGWSYGGMLTNYTIAQDTRFKAAVSGASISNILAGYGTDQYIREYEFELGPPWKNFATWTRVSFPFLHADRIVTPTLFLCGQEDFNVPLLNSEQMYQALRRLGIDTQLVIYPGQYHGLTKPSYWRDRLERYLAWYGKYLMPKATASTSAK